MKEFLKVSILLILVSFHLFGQNKPPYWNEIQVFKKMDSIHPPRPKSILLVGSSSFTKWTDVQNYFPGYPIINRGFGGSSLTDLILYAPDIILAYHPKQIIIYCGENDFASSLSLTDSLVFERFKTLYKIIRKKYPVVPIDYISMKPSPSRRKFLTQFIQTNTLIKQYLSKEKNTGFINIYSAMLDAKGKMRPELYLPDSLHMKPLGYAIWKEKMLPYLVK